MIEIATPEEFESSKIPMNPGVYIYRDENGEILYIGKAKNLRSRVRNYFSNSDKLAKTKKLVSRIHSIDWVIVNTEVEALLLENKLIKQHTPKYNINLKDAKTFAYIALTKEPFPRIMTSRRVSRKLESFGPYTDGFARQDLQRLVVRVFKLRVCRRLPKKACLNFHIGLCSAPCEGNVSQGQYSQQVEQARSFLGGDYEKTVTMLISQMQNASQHLQYERALELRNQIASIRLLNQRQIVDKERRFDQDVMVFRRSGEKMLAVHMGVRKGVLLGKKEFCVDLQPQVEQEFLRAFYSSNLIPREILLNQICWESNTEKIALRDYFSSRRGAPVCLKIPRRGNKFELVKLAEKNLESSLGKDTALVDLQVSLNIPVLPRVIESFDVSNLGQQHIVSGMVRFTDAKPDKSNFRRFKIRTVNRQDDFASMHEVITRRYKRLLEEKAAMPDLVIVDGGPGQVSAAKSALESLGLQLPLIGIAKEREEIYLPDDPNPKRYSKNSRMMLLLRKIRDATHDFALGYNIKRRIMKLREEFKAE